MSAQTDPSLQFEASPQAEQVHAAVPEHGADERRPARLALYAGVALLALGWLIVYLGYNGAATHTREIQQLPYVVSGGFGGLALIILGGVAIAANIALSVQSALRGDLRAVHGAIEELVDTLSAGFMASNAESRNGTVVVVRGGSSFHRPGCRLVANKAEQLRKMSAPAARDKGLTPCRICKPHAAAAGVG
jgi:hypothetical protein